MSFARRDCQEAVTPGVSAGEEAVFQRFKMREDVTVEAIQALTGAGIRTRDGRGLRG